MLKNNGVEISLENMKNIKQGIMNDNFRNHFLEVTSALSVYHIYIPLFFHYEKADYIGFLAGLPFGYSP